MVQLKNKNILVIGLAKTGISTLKFLHKLNANVIVNDIKTKDELASILSELKELNNIEFILGKHIEDISNIDLAVISPGVPLDIPFVIKLKENNIEVIGEVELAYRAFNQKNVKPNIISITGTNGKTTTTSLTGELFKNANKDTHVVGNIGNPIIDTVDIVSNDSYVISELSSFQLESIKEFNSHISLILNITPDHLNRHHTIENYIDAKSNIFKNQTNKDITILNFDDLTVQELNRNTKGTVYYISTKEKLLDINKKGAYINEDGNIIINIDSETILMHKSDLSLPGVHNLQNSLATALIGYLSGLDLDVIKYTLSTFKGVEHRQEFVRNLNGVKYINDSKATNPDSTIKALNSYDNPIILIAGGMDKKSDFKELSLEIIKNTKGLILFGETAYDIQKSVRMQGYEFIISEVDTLADAVKTAYKLSKPNDIVLLSPACASWDMYKNFEERGNEFKDLVNQL